MKIKRYTKISESFPWKVEKLSIFSASFLTLMQLQDKWPSSNNPCIKFASLFCKQSTRRIGEKKKYIQAYECHNYQIHEVRSPFQQRSPTPTTSQNSVRQQRREQNNKFLLRHGQKANSHVQINIFLTDHQDFSLFKNFKMASKVP